MGRCSASLRFSSVSYGVFAVFQADTHFFRSGFAVFCGRFANFCFPVPHPPLPFMLPNPYSKKCKPTQKWQILYKKTGYLPEKLRICTTIMQTMLLADFSVKENPLDISKCWMISKCLTVIVRPKLATTVMQCPQVSISFRLLIESSFC